MGFININMIVTLFINRLDFFLSDINSCIFYGEKELYFYIFVFISYYFPRLLFYFHVQSFVLFPLNDREKIFSVHELKFIIKKVLRKLYQRLFIFRSEVLWLNQARSIWLRKVQKHDFRVTHLSSKLVNCYKLEQNKIAQGYFTFSIFLLLTFLMTSLRDLFFKLIVLS